MFSDATLGKASSIPTDWKLQLKNFNQIIFKPRWIFWSMFKWNVPDAFVSLAGPARCVTWTSTTARRTPAPTAASASTRSTTSPASAKPASPESAASTPSTTARPSLARTAERAQVSSCWHFPCLQFMTSQVIAERTIDIPDAGFCCKSAKFEQEPGYWWWLRQEWMADKNCTILGHFQADYSFKNFIQ